MEFKRDKKTGLLHAFKDDKDLGPIRTMGDDVGYSDWAENSRKRKEKESDNEEIPVDFTNLS